LSEILGFEKKWLEYVNTNHKSLVDDIASKTKVTDESMEGLHNAMQSFLAENEFAARA